ncbi:hypothetical protein OWM54_14160 [Myxococcus sp. MISCRS1]|uniref:hypothetical protein n=1 Tax=Myxococcus TaxID=32 RepID=UPI0020C0B29D|nr:MULTISPECIES: hypothetical protein [Myxococcus]MCK8497672.1 hypothetical protein [Myxococcus fulvus]MCY0998275.1 hypothetical protein [Myxococcus sp. MISCRS1]
MLVIIPVFMYAIFLDDLLRHTLDAQETALSTIWDYAVSDYAAEPTGGEAFAGFGQTQGLARQMYCDHESGIDSYQTDPPECRLRTMHHHQELVAHACWMHPEAQQVECTVDQNAVGSYGVTLHASYMRQFNRGGLIRCSSRSGVQNYLLPTTFLQEFSQVDLAKEHKDGDVHDNAEAKGDRTKDTYYLPWERIALVTDTWALTTPQNTEPGVKDTEPTNVYVRVAHIYSSQENSGFTQMSPAAEQLVRQAIQRKLLDTSLQLDNDAGDDPRNVSISIKAQTGSNAPTQRIDQGDGAGTYFNNEWRDWEANNNQATAQARGEYYMGCQQPGKC